MVLRAETYSYLTDYDNESKKAKGKKKTCNKEKTYI